MIEKTTTPSIKALQVEPQGGSATSLGLPTTTTILAHCSLPAGQRLYIRGSTLPLSWERGHPMEEVEAGVWCWQYNGPLSPTEYKLVIDDTSWESGDNHLLFCGEQHDITPTF